MLFDIFNRLQRIDHLIQIRGTGTASELGEKLGLSRTTTYEYLDLMKQLGAPIKYDTARRSYYYDQDGYLTTKFQRRQTANEIENNVISIVSIITLLSSELLNIAIEI